MARTSKTPLGSLSAPEEIIPHLVYHSSNNIRRNPVDFHIRTCYTYLSDQFGEGIPPGTLLFCRVSDKKRPSCPPAHPLAKKRLFPNSRFRFLLVVKSISMKLLPEKYLREAFDIGVILKGVNGVLETVGGFALLFLNPAYVGAVLNFFANQEFISLTARAQFFGALYLITHGVVKIVLVAGLLRNRLWAYPAAIAVFTLFGLYQAYYLLQEYSLWLLALTVLDVIVILLTWHEWNYRSKHHELAH